METTYYNLTAIEQALDFISCLVKCKASYQYRGLGRENYSLKTSIERTYDDEELAFHGYQIEEKTNLVRYFQIAHQYTGEFNADPNSLIEIWSLMQHHGARTRLLDFTRSFPVALHFALSQINSIDNPVVWCVNSDNLESKLKSKLETLAGDAQYFEQFTDLKNPHTRAEWRMEQFTIDPGGNRLINHILHHSLKGKYSLQPWVPNLAIPVSPPRFNRRLLMQSGCFLMPINPNAPFLTNLRGLLSPEDSEDQGIVFHQKEPTCDSFCEAMNRMDTIVLNFEKIKLQDLTYLLGYLNVRGETLFPDFSGLMQELGRAKRIPKDRR